MRFSQKLLNLCQGYQTPFFLVDQTRIIQKYDEIKKSIPGARIFYAVKANPHLEIIKTLVSAGSGFEVSSTRELELVLAAGASPAAIISNNPVKTVDFLLQAHRLGVAQFAVDSREEIRKIAEYAPGSRVVVRITVDNTGSEWPLSRKYGVDAWVGITLLQQAARQKLVPYGLTFHVGSQCLNKENWVSALFLCHQIWDLARKQGLDLQMLSLGGGFPVAHGKKIPRIEEIGSRISQTVKQLFGSEGVILTVEPGRALVGEAAILVASVIGKASRGLENWLYLDVGVFNGLLEASQGFGYEIKTEAKGRRKSFVLAGPSCDSVDTISHDVALPPLQTGDRVYIMNAGAYTLSYASSFNGFPPPSVYFVP